MAIGVNGRPGADFITEPTFGPHIDLYCEFAVMARGRLEVAVRPDDRVSPESVSKLPPIQASRSSIRWKAQSEQ
jgi:hypothetical protein